MDGKHSLRQDDTLTDRLFWPVLCVCGIALFCFGMFFQSMRGGSAPVKAPSPAAPVAVQSAPTTAPVPDNSAPQPITPPRELPAGPALALDPAPPPPTTTNTPSSEHLEGTYGPRGPPPVNGVAENGSKYGDISPVTGKPKTVSVRGYTRKNGTYVQGHYRSK